MLQLDLFADLPIPPDACPWKRAQPHRLEAAPITVEQLAFTFRLRELESDRDTEFDYPHHTVGAQWSAPPVTTAPRSIFDLGAEFKKLKRAGRFGAAQGFKTTTPAPPRMVARVEVEQGVTRHVGAAYPSRWTPEDEERERQRRARQRPPRPTKKARTRSRKLVELVGNDEQDE